MRLVQKNLMGFCARQSHLKDTDPKIYNLISAERDRQLNSINLIASENYCSNACFAAVGSVLNNKYAEGYPGARYYGGTVNVDGIEDICRERALEAFSLSKEEWGVNVQSLSGSPANFAVYTGLLETHDRIMSLDLPHGGHLSHGYQNNGKKISSVSKYFEVLPYFLNVETGIIDYEGFHKNALIYRPKLIVAGTSAYSRLIDYPKMRQIADDVGAILHCDISHPAGLMSAGLIPSAFDYADTVMTTTHKTMRGPRGSLIFYRIGSYKNKKGEEIKRDYKQRIDAAVFPGLQGGPHMHSIAGVAVAMQETRTPEFKQYQKQVLLNIRRIAEKFISNGYVLPSGGTDNHLFLLDMRSKGLTGANAELILTELNISINKNTVPGDKSALNPSGIRIGSPAMTTRGLKEADFEVIYEFIDRSTKIGQGIKSKCKEPKLAEFKKVLESEVQSSEFQKLKQ